MQLKKYFQNWNSNRTLKLVIGLLLGIAYIISGKAFYLGLSIFLLVQAILNFSCNSCAGGNCTTNIKNNNKNPYDINKVDINKNDK